MSEKQDKKIETFREYVTRRLMNREPAERVETWDSRNRGEGVASWSGKNHQKRERRAAWKIDRLAQIRAFRRFSDRHVPTLKHIPQEVFE